MPDGTNVVYFYDGSFEGFLTAVFTAFETRDNIRTITALDACQPAFDDEIRVIETDEVKADRVIAGLRKKLSYEAYKKIYISYLSELSGWEMAALDWIRLAFKAGTRIFGMLNDSRVIAVNDYSKKVGFEYQRMVGFVRFSEMENGVYFSEITPTYNITAMLMPHFANRFNSQPFILYDKKRKIAGVNDRERWYMVDAGEMNIPDISKDEAEYRRLWCAFYRTAAIEERKSETRRMRMMPKKYWVNMLEISAEEKDKINETVTQ